MREVDLLSPRQIGVRCGEIRLECERLFQQLDGSRRISGRYRGNVRQSSQIEVVGIKTLGTLPSGSLDLGFPDAWLDNADDLFRDLILKFENVRQTSVELLSPKKCARSQLRRAAR